MKKLFMIGLAATAMLASCSNDETVEMAQSKAIGFSNAFVNNGTRSIVDPSFTTETLEDFAVYGFTQAGQIFNGTTVSAPGWTYTPLQYWVAGNTYTFGAIAPAAQKDNVSNVTLLVERSAWRSHSPTTVQLTFFMRLLTLLYAMTHSWHKLIFQK